MSQCGVYMLVNRINGCAYIGRSREISRRWMEHRCPSARRRKTALGRALQKYGAENFDLVVLEYCLAEELDEKEQYYIRLYQPAYNMNEGGKGNSRYRVTDRMRKILSEKSKRQWEMSSEEEKRRRIVNNLKGPPKGHPVKLETREKLRRAAVEHYKIHGPSERQRLAVSRRVAKLSIDTGEILGVFDSLTQAAKNAGVTSVAIGHACRSPNGTSAGYKWKYLD